MNYDVITTPTKDETRYSELNTKELKIFNNEEFGNIRTVLIDGEPWLVGKDIAEALGYAKARNAIAAHVSEDDKKDAPIQGDLGGTQQMTIINESGMYALIFGSKLESANRFKHWVTSDVLPTIRRTGSYHLPRTYKEALVELVAQVEENERLALENATMKPKADYFDDLVERNMLTNFRTTAKEFGMKESEFINWLLENKYIYRDAKNKLQPYSIYVDKGLFEIKEYVNPHSNHAGTQTLITPKGRETFRLLLKK